MLKNLFQSFKIYSTNFNYLLFVRKSVCLFVFVGCLQKNFLTVNTSNFLFVFLMNFNQFYITQLLPIMILKTIFEKEILSIINKSIPS